ncbi:hypothetical protein F1C58_05610 [Glaciihabitans sp. INWT7]|uniref:hypothetical protein n=1 Tax=Glaciihabitans sp. INWT7 TaxID=2596912 RepID=UPI001624325D|nr:hypothetical protein [Glaciihabitans sp. INWT7]QNE46437.1 hypothetical protein F1C58_05610 [Glaciihabitans sp. INWT7]
MTLFDQDTYALPSAPRRRSRLARVLPTVLALILVAAGVLAFLGFQRLLDQYTVWTFRPSAEVSALIDSSHLTEEGRFQFLASKPVIESSTTFASSCASNQEGSGILGCYLPRNRSIHLFAVTDPRLLGLTDVVAAHEMLHAVWDRLNTAQQQQLVPLLEHEAAKLAGNADFQARLEYYAKNEPGERDNELHSIIGTEIASISPELEAHYAKWLGDRQAIVALQVKTDAVFTDLENRSIALSSSLDSLRSTIDAEYAAYTSGYAQLNADIRRFNARTDFTSNRQIDLAEAALDARQVALDAKYADVLAKTAEYNADRDELKALSEQTAGLNSALNQGPGTTLSTPVPATGSGG